MDISQIITPEDAVKLEDNKQYQFYFDLVQHAMGTLVEGTRRLHNEQVSQQETEFVRLSAERLLYTLNALELRYLHIDENTMEIDVTDSGFPNSSALRFLSNEISFIEKGAAAKIEEVDPLIDACVEKLMVRKEHISNEDIAQTAFSLFHKRTDPKQLYDMFVFGAVRPSELLDYDFVVYWMNYDVLINRPFISIMYFDIEAKNTGQRKYDEEEIINAIKNTVPASTPQSVIYDIDKNVEEIVPKLFKRIDIGPLANIFTRDDRQVSLALREGIRSKNLPMDAFALEIKMDQVKSTGEVDTGGIFSFINKKKIQNWSEPTSFKFLMAPHNVIQYLHNNHSETLKGLTKHPIDVEAIKKDN